ncbi:hypothetical protein DFH07DRAFT_888745 [Mycena maculata]|uniref:F-box domain-containing protein n=1 Tax=Mycena maculata TaxID=230809 RepID=A0AAD7IT15_9AGAR|nr:hypothetical protein DFH07DRAFT_888745 [Mycena maculata]
MVHDSIMSAAELQALIENISVDIDRQKEVLKELELRKIAAQRKFNAIRDPVGRMPLEISSEIFVLCLGRLPQPGSLHPPMLLLNICHVWSAIALSTPELWSRIHVDGNQGYKLPTLLDTWLKRAGSRALFLSFRGSFHMDTVAVIRRYTRQVQELATAFEGDELRSIIVEGELPALKTLRVMGAYDTSEAIDILRLLPHLVECSFDDLTADFLIPEMLVHPQMQHFELGGNEKILSQIRLPGLKTLLLPMSYGDSSNQFLRDSLPPLRSVTFGWRPWTANEMEECFSLLPKLTHLELSNTARPGLNTATSLLVTILGNSPHLLPNLSSLACQFGSFKPDNPWYSQLLNMLLARRTKMKVVQMVMDLDRIAAPPSDVCAALRQLVADGMVIHIGADGQTLM